MNYRTCNKCGWVYFGISREHAENEVKRFNDFFETLSKKEQNDYYGGKKSDIFIYEKCWCGNHYSNFREFKEGDCPTGVTINPIISETLVV